MGGRKMIAAHGGAGWKVSGEGAQSPKESKYPDSLELQPGSEHIMVGSECVALAFRRASERLEPGAQAVLPQHPGAMRIRNLRRAKGHGTISIASTGGSIHGPFHRIRQRNHADPNRGG